MKRLTVLFNVFILISVSSLIGCGIGTLKTTEQKEIYPGEDIDPFDFGDEFSQTTGGGNTTAESIRGESTEINTGSKSLRNRDTLNSSERYRGSNMQGNQLTSENFGYRVQIGIFENKENARKRAAASTHSTGD